MKFCGLNRYIFRWIYLIALIFLAVWFVSTGGHFQSTQPDTLTTTEAKEFNPVKEPIQPIPTEINLDQRKVKLGEKLFQDVRLSSDHKISCLSCHRFSQGGADRRSYSVGVNGSLTEVNTPTVFNARFNHWLNWNGKFEDLTDHLQHLLMTAKIFEVRWETLLPELQKIPEYRQAFTAIYPDGLTRTTLIDAIATYEKSLNTPNSRFDQFLRGNQHALTAAEQQGYQLFKAYGCISCHQGVNVGGNMFQRFGVIGDYFADRGQIMPADLGRFNVTHNPADRFVFRVPSLRNVAVTAPYFHDGSAPTLEKAIAVMVKYQLGRSLPQEQMNKIAQFLRTLTGDYQGKPLSK